MKRINAKRTLAAGIAALSIAGAVGASASTLGGLDEDQLGADTGDVSACDDDGIDVDWRPVFDAASAQYVAYFTLSDIDTDCLQTPYKISIFQKGENGFRAFGDFNQFAFFTRYNRPSDGQQVVRAGYQSTFPAELVEAISIVITG